MNKSQSQSKPGDKIYRLALSSCKEFNENVENSEYFTFKINDEKRQLIYLKDSQKVLEIKVNYDKHSHSFFLGNYVQTGSDYLQISEIDPLFLTIPFLIEARGKTQGDNQGKKVDKDEVFVNNNNNENVDKVIEIIKNNDRIQKNLSKICSFSKFGDDEFIRLEDNLLFSWLDEKVKKAENIFKIQLQKFIPQQSISKTEVSQENYTILALSLVYSYIPQVLFIRYLNKYELTEAQFFDYMKVKQVQQNPEEQIEDGTGFNQKQNQNKQNQAKKPNTKEEKDAKAAKGTKSLLSFFKPKAK